MVLPKVAFAACCYLELCTTGFNAPIQRLVVAAILIALIPVGVLLPALTSLGMLTGVLVALVIYEAIRFREIRHRIRFDEH